MNEAQVSVLDRPVYGLSDAAVLLGLRRSLVGAWLDGYERKGVRYPPVVRPGSTGDSVVSWGEFVELGLLREYRSKEVPLQRLRPVIEALREEFQTPYPLATAKPYVGDRELVMKLQEDSGLPQRFAIVVRSGQTLMLASKAERFLKKVEFVSPADGDVCRLYPAGKTSPVVIDPLVRFCRPAVNGVAVERLWELHDAGESVEQIVEAYEMKRHRVEAAIAYFEQHRTLAA